MRNRRIWEKAHNQALIFLDINGKVKKNNFEH